MTDIKLIAIDLDGTLLDSNRELSKQNYQAIQDTRAGRYSSRSLYWTPFTVYELSVR